MKKSIFIIVSLISCVWAYGQSTDLSDEEARHFKRAGIAVELAQSAEDYKEAVVEYEKVLETATRDADVWYRLAVCCEAVAQADNSYYKRSSNAYRKALEYGESMLDAEKKKELRDKIEEMDYAAQLAAKKEKNRISPSTLCGVWHFHDSSGKANEAYDIIIKENAGFYSVEYIILRQKEGGNDKNMDTRRNGDISINNDVISFSTTHRFALWQKGWRVQVSDSKMVLEYSLRLENGRLVGVARKTELFEAFNSNGYRTVHDAVKARAARVVNDCSGDCGSFNVYFTR